jgi:UMF1 family MFS transporter|tara:strand:- start:408 stop:1694 length:1287 start_codon:yes stop_codon:yes gene_type:complete
MKFNKIQKGWAMYDWANSVYSLAISTVLLPIYYEEVTNSDMKVHFLGSDWKNTVIYSYVIAASYLTISLLSPYFAAMADRTGRRKIFMNSFMILGGVSTMLMYFFTAQNPGLGLALAFFASVGFTGSFVFYNSYLPIIAPKSMQDRLSARGFSLGYLGSALLLIFCLALIQMPEFFGLPDASSATRVSFLITGVWWLGFGLPAIARLPKDQVKDYFEGKLFFKSWRELLLVWKEFKTQKELRMFLSGFFWYSTGMQTIVLLAALFGSKVLGMESTELIVTILLIQFVAILGATIFSRISERTSNVFAISIGVAIWMLICAAAYFVTTSFQFYGIAASVGMVLGAVQSLSRSTYSKLLPETEDHSTYFSFYDVVEKMATTIGMFSIGLLEAITGDLRNSALALTLFFAIGLVRMFKLHLIQQKTSIESI